MEREAHITGSWVSGMRRRPMVGLAGCFIAGIFLHRVAPPWALTWILAGLGLAGLACIARRILADAALGLAAISAGVASAQLAGHHYPRQHLAHYSADQPRLAQVELRIDQPPRVLHDAHARAPASMPPAQAMQATALRVLTHDGWQETSGRVLVRCGEVNARLAAGQRVRATGMLSRPPPAANPGQFDWARYYRDQRILCSLRVSGAGNIIVLEHARPGPLLRMRLAARRALELGFPAERSLDQALLRALVLGDPDPQLRDVQEQFLRTGLSHHLAISGMHIVIIGGLAWVLCKALFMPPRLAAGLGLGIVLLYALVVLPSPPVVRSMLLCLAYVVGLLGRRSLDAVQLLALSVLAMLMYHPPDLYNAGFQLSFVTVLGLMTCSTPVLRAIEAARDPDLLTAGTAIRYTRWQSLLRQLRISITATLVAGAVAWLASAPIVEYHFNQLNPWQVFSSIALALPVFLSLILGVTKIVLTLAWPGLAGWWAALAAWPVQWMRQMVEWLAMLPAADVSMPSLPLWAMAIYFALMAAPFWPGLRQTWRRFALAAGGCALVLLVPMRLGSDLSRPGELRLMLLSVGDGQCAILHTPGGRTALIDAGSSSMPDVAGSALIPYLKHAGIRRIDFTFISHADRDHRDGLPAVARRFSAGRIFVAGQFEAQLQACPISADALAELGEREVVMPGMKLELDEQTSIEVLWPPPGLRASPNDESLVLRVSCAGRSVLLPGDITGLAKRQILRSGVDVRADVLVAPHHGSSEADTGRFLDAVDPGIIIASNGPRLSEKQKRFDRLAAGRELYRTHNRGATTIIIRDGQLMVQTHR
jgi:competence protein ComEC